jgi:hypothetical protein
LVRTAIDFSWLNQGTYTFDRIDAYGGGSSVLTDGITIQVGFIVGLFGMMLKRGSKA